jgi:hypothetical protein
MQKYGFASSPSACVVSTKFEVDWVGKTPGELKQHLLMWCTRVIEKEVPMGY